ncbi:MAG: hypothetical protein QGG25_10945 [Phycisphaerae bacterium]|jgi:hypothetical protein|nr:hypothetical protein [Phycisphaerae bacterium]
MIKREYIIVAFLAAVAAFFCSGWVYNALERVVLAHGGQAVVAKPTAGVSITMQFLPPFVLTCAAIPIAFMVVRDPWHAVTVLVLAIGAAGVSLLVIHYRIHATFTWYDRHGHHAMVPLEQLHLEVIPWVSLGVLTLGMIVQRVTHEELGPHPGRPDVPNKSGEEPAGDAAE